MSLSRITTSLLSFGKALLFMLGSLAGRAMLTPWLGQRVPFLVLTLSIVLAARYCRWRATAAAAVIGFLLTAWLFVPTDQPDITPSMWAVGVVGFVFMATAIIALGEMLHRSKARVETELMEGAKRERSLLEQTRQLREAQTLSHIGSWYWDATTDAFLGSEELYRIFGLDPVTDALPRFSGQRGIFYSEEGWERLSHAVQNTARTGIGHRLDLEGRCRDKKIWVTTRGERVTSAEGKVLGLRGTVQDITELRAAEEALRRSTQRMEIVKDIAEVGFWFCDLPFAALEWDSLVKEHFWLPPEASVTIDLFYARLHPEDREKTRLKIEESIAHRQRFEMEYRTVCPQDGRIKWIRSVGRPFYAEDGRPIRFDGATFDVTENRRAETLLRESETAARAASAAKDAFIAQLSHELRTPLTPVLMTASALKEDESVPEEVRRQLRMIERNIALEARLIDDLLDITRITHGKLALRTEPCNAHSLLRHVVEMVQDEAREKGVRFSLDLEAAKPQLLGDSTRLQQVYWNILRNAVKFSPAGSCVTIRSRNIPCPDSGHALCIEIEDQGMGFDEAVKERIFEPFEQGATSRDSRAPGLGLGLAITRAIVILHGGRVEAHSEGPGKGACFTICLPGATQETPGAEPDAAGGGTHDAEAQQPLRLLVVEDHEQSLHVLSRLLTGGGHSVVGAGTKAEALVQANQREFDAVISDLGLPDGTGHELMKILHTQHGLRGIALSGYGTDEDLQASREAGFVAHLIKPVRFAELRHALHALGHAGHRSN